ncbi:DctP family TRAP transporter solute-binding subunit [Jeotgalicoccus halotolerans]|uniref:Tripartite ATP-independent transporter DctP family solute receptor n=1 Tax=Jeotgalicoccus halotolerans TaxID=157227 RepID=A0A3E0AX03_9STAP|nr:DctP family TRAP transporter solute-binding subunit [Jeotgalicoccus halotolerans]REG24259.1 tripartite ATP-independent transporter DctP family solute receptor [Jeotgalicoccus halotolerans]
MRKYTLLAGVLSFLLLLAACSKDDESVTLQFGHALPPDTNQAIEINKMAEAVEEETEGRVKFEIYPNSQLGSETEMLQQVDVGAMNGLAVMVGSMQTMDMRLAIEDLPYMWPSEQEAREAYDGEFGEYIADIVEEYGMHTAGYLEWGFRHVTNNEGPVVKPEDLKGMNIRVAETALRVDTFEQAGALPTVMAFSEVYGALQQGALDAQENPLANIVAPRFNEVQDYLSLTGHFYNTVMVVIDGETWEEISIEDQKILTAEIDKISKEIQAANDETESEHIKFLAENGMEVNDNVDKEAFREAMMPVYDKWEDTVFGKEMMDMYRRNSGWEDDE